MKGGGGGGGGRATLAPAADVAGKGQTPFTHCTAANGSVLEKPAWVTSLQCEELLVGLSGRRENTKRSFKTLWLYVG